MYVKGYIVDTLAYISFWSFLTYFINVILVGIPIGQFIASSILGLIVTSALAGVFGRYLDYVRKKFHVNRAGCACWQNDTKSPSGEKLNG